MVNIATFNLHSPLATAHFSGFRIKSAEPPKYTEFDKTFPELEPVILTPWDLSTRPHEELSRLFARVTHERLGHTLSEEDIRISMYGANAPDIKNLKNFFLVYMNKQTQQAVGSIAFRQHATKPVAEVTNFYVEESYRKRKLGIWLLRELSYELVKAHVQVIIAKTQFPRVEKNYLSIGMEQIGISPTGERIYAMPIVGNYNFDDSLRAYLLKAFNELQQERAENKRQALNQMA